MFNAHYVLGTVTYSLNEINYSFQLYAPQYLWEVIDIEFIRIDKLGHFLAICAKSPTSDVRLNADPQNLIENKSNHGKLTLIVSL